MDTVLYSIPGGMIVNVLRSSCIIAARRKERLIFESDIIEGIKAELRKDGKTVQNSRLIGSGTVRLTTAEGSSFLLSIQ